MDKFVKQRYELMANKEHLKILRKGVEAWNDWRRKNPNVIPDITGESFKNENLASINFAKADLRDCDFQSNNLAKADFSKANICGCDFRGINLEAANFSEAQAGQTPKQLAILIPIACGFGLLGVPLVGLSFPTGAPAAVIGMGFFAGEFAFATLLDITYKFFDNEKVRKLNGTSFARSILDRAKFVNAKLDNCDFSKASIKQVDWKDSQFNRLCFFPSDFNSKEIQLLCITRKGDSKSFKTLNLSNLDLTNVNFRDSNLQGCNLNSTILRNAVLNNVNLYGISAIDTDFSGADMTGSYIKNHSISPGTKIENIKCEYIYLEKDAK